MTNERALELLRRLQDEQFDGIHGDERREALEMAVRALSGDGGLISRKMAIEAFEPTHYKDWYTPTIIETLETLPSVQLVKEPDGLVNDLVKDCISRQQAIDALDKHIDTFDAIDKNYLCGLRTAMSILKEMPSAQPETHDKRTETQINTLDCVSRQVAIDALTELRKKTVASDSFRLGIYYSIEEIKNVPSAQSERDIPVKPIETTDKAWGIPKRQAVCPKCDYYLGHVAFFGDYKGKRITYCETCGQAIDWEGWDFDE